jgi:hypothetical protein
LVKSIVKQLCAALDYLHTECKVVHTGRCIQLVLSRILTC